MRVCQTCVVVDSNLKTCSKCKQAYYCSVDCQKKDWARHKPLCGISQGKELTIYDKLVTQEIDRIFYFSDRTIQNQKQVKHDKDIRAKFYCEKTKIDAYWKE